MTDTSVSLLARRKRGRPRKDGNLSREGRFQSSENGTLMKTQNVEVTSPAPNDIKKTQESVDGMVGSMIYGVIEGSFDAGYLISVRIGNNDTPFRGVVFQPKKFIPITAANDIAPQARMFSRREIPVPVYDDLGQISGFSPQPEKVTPQPVQASKQAVFRPILPSMHPSATPYSSYSNQPMFMVPESMMLRTSSCSNMGEKITSGKSPNVGVDKQTGNLRMMEQDEVMQAFEVSTSSRYSLPGKESINQKTQVHGKAVESGLESSMLAHNRMKGSNMELHHNFMEDMPQSAFEIQQDEMMCRHSREFFHEGLQSPTIDQVHAVPRDCQTTKMPTDLYYNELRSPDVNFHQDLFTDQSQPDSQGHKCLGGRFHSNDFVDRVPKSPNLKLDLASSVHEKKPLQPEAQARDACLETNYLVFNELKNPNLGYHQALVSGNPLLLPPDLIGEPLEFMLEKAKSPSNSKNRQETNSELETRVVGTDERFHAETGGGAMSAPYKLELATPQSTLNRRPGNGKQTASSAGRLTDMDFVLSDVVQSSEFHGHQRDSLE